MVGVSDDRKSGTRDWHCLLGCGSGGSRSILMLLHMAYWIS